MVSVITMSTWMLTKLEMAIWHFFCYRFFPTLTGQLYLVFHMVCNFFWISCSFSRILLACQKFYFLVLRQLQQCDSETLFMAKLNVHIYGCSIKSIYLKRNHRYRIQDLPLKYLIKMILRDLLHNFKLIMLGWKKLNR